MQGPSPPLRLLADGVGGRAIRRCPGGPGRHFSLALCLVVQGPGGAWPAVGNGPVLAPETVRYSRKAGFFLGDSPGKRLANSPGEAAFSCRVEFSQRRARGLRGFGSCGPEPPGMAPTGATYPAPGKEAVRAAGTDRCSQPGAVRGPGGGPGLLSTGGQVATLRCGGAGTGAVAPGV